ncbi:MAG: NAD(+)/NADH kinase [Pseudomonadaceae bacterium]|nr:NAD(+)/NADH kinase [Pseudomonadaceae bacterium]
MTSNTNQATDAGNNQTFGVIANPASGKDLRRLVARASVFDNQEKQAIVQRALAGAIAGGVTDIRYMPDTHGITECALKDVGRDAPFSAIAVDSTDTATALDTISAARAMAALPCALVMTLGGDGTNRAVCLGWPDAPLLPISTGTNNVFPTLIEATVAGAAAAAVATGRVALADVAHQNKVVLIEIDDERDDIALIDAVVTSDRFVGSRALLEPDRLRLLLLTRAEPAAVGMTAIGGLMRPMPDSEDAGLLVECDPASERKVNAPIAPGHYRPIGISNLRAVALGETIVIEGPAALAFDGERERTLKPGQKARMKIMRCGPRVIDPVKTMRLLAAA